MITDELMASIAECDHADAPALLAKLTERLGGVVSVQSVLSDIEESSTESPTFETLPRSLTPELLPVPRFDIGLLPAELRGWTHDIAERGSFPIEYVAVSAMVALSAVVGRQCGIKPKRHDDWLAVPNLWGMIVGKPGVFKSPALAEALKPLHRLETTARDKHKAELAHFEAQKQVSDAMAKAAKSKLDAQAKSGKASPEALLELAKQTTAPDSEKPTCTRYVINDASAEKLQELLGENPNGILLLRDELSGLLKSLDKQGHENDRAFYLECWDGTRGYTSDRIGRGTTYCDAACLSMLGTIQPGVLSKHLKGATTGDTADGLMPRFQLMVYPDTASRFVNVDRYPNTDAKNTAYGVFTRLAELDAASIGAVRESEEAIPFLRFDHDAQAIFDSWRELLENRLRSDSESPALTEHLAKYRSLMPSIALLLHLAGDGYGAVPVDCAYRAIRWCELLEAHARRVYGAAFDAPMEAAEQLATRIKQSLANPFTVRDVVRKGWGGLSTQETVTQALGVLEDRGWVSIVERKPDGRGRPSQEVYINPALRKGTETENKNYESVKSLTDKNDKNNATVDFPPTEPVYEEGEL